MLLSLFTESSSYVDESDIPMDRLGDTGRPKVWVATSSVAEATLYVMYEEAK
jgi:hypothetical protein